MFMNAEVVAGTAPFLALMEALGKALRSQLVSCATYSSWPCLTPNPQVMLPPTAPSLTFSPLRSLITTRLSRDVVPRFRTPLRRWGGERGRWQAGAVGLPAGEHGWPRVGGDGWGGWEGGGGWRMDGWVKGERWWWVAAAV